MAEFIIFYYYVTETGATQGSWQNLLKIPGRVKQLRLNTTHKLYNNQATTGVDRDFLFFKIYCNIARTPILKYSSVRFHLWK